MDEQSEAQASIAIVDDHRLFASGLSLMLSGPPLNGRVSVFTSLKDFVAATRKLGLAEQWRLVVLDLYIPGTAPREMVSETRALCEDATILVVSGSIARNDRRLCLEAGADDYVGKSVDPDRLLEIIGDMLSNAGRSAPSEDREEIADHAAESVGLSPRQMEILIQAAQGLTNKEIAQALSVSPETIKTHFAEIFRRFGVRNRIEAVDAARARGIA
ncbi:MAG: response regulator transcription factor [Pseudomonadota bacterium]